MGPQRQKACQGTETESESETETKTKMIYHNGSLQLGAPNGVA